MEEKRSAKTAPMERTARMEDGADIAEMGYKPRSDFAIEPVSPGKTT
jgi:hypothetical protein